MAEATAKVSRGRRVAPIWIVPIVALAIGLWMVVYTYQNRGPEIEIIFELATGIEAGNTKIKYRDVEIGLVEKVVLNDDLETVSVTAQIELEASDLLRADTQFWVVRARFGASGISGLGTVLSGGYIQLALGTSERRKRHFVGLEDPPVTPTGTPGLQIRLVSDEVGAVSTGDPILYEGFRVGRIESAALDVPNQEMRYTAFIDDAYTELVSENTRFWNASGFSLSTTANGVSVQAASLESLLTGGVSMGLPSDLDPGDPVDDGALFELFADYASVNEKPFRYSLDYVIEFAQSVRGLEPGAPVAYRGITMGRVDRILLDEMGRQIGGVGDSIPVQIRLEPGRLKLGDDAAGVERLREALQEAVKVGLRASLATGNLLTGSRYIALNIHSRAEPAEIGLYGAVPTIPATQGGLEGLESQAVALLDKLNTLPLEDVAQNAANALATLDSLLANRELNQLPAQLDGAVADLRAALAAVTRDGAVGDRLAVTLNAFERTLDDMRALLTKLSDRPSSILFSPPVPDDPALPSGSQ